MLKVWLLGKYEVELNGKRVDIPGRPAQTLLAYLMLHPRTAHRREFLAGMLWPEADEENARGNLRTWLWQLRKALEDASDLIVSDRVSIAFSPQEPFWLDVEAVTQPEAPTTPLNSLETAISHYGGDLLPGLYEDWVLRERDRIFAIFELKIQRVLNQLLVEERWSDGVVWCERWLALDPVSEPAYRDLMTIYASQGELAKVSAVYKRCTETLRKELDVSPAPITVSLFEQLQQGTRMIPGLANAFAKRYRLGAEIGRGGMGIVYQATDTLLEREVALKVLHAPPPVQTDLLVEARAVARLSHPNIVTVYDAGNLHGRPAIVMERVKGQTLDQWQPQTWEEVFDFSAQIADALVEAHGRGIIHRDIKPQNIFVQIDPRLNFKLVDFGIAYRDVTGQPPDEKFLGTLAYLAPEQIQKNESDQRTDLYALGVVLYELVTNQLPFTAEEPMVLLWQRVNRPVTPPREMRADVPQALNDLILRLLAKEPEGRYASARQLAEAVSAARQLSQVFTQPQSVPVPNNLPYQVSNFIGREKDLKQVREMLGASRLVTLIGSGGAGKTRLSLEVAREVLAQFSDGVWFVELALVADPALVVQAVANALQIREQGQKPLLENLILALKDKTALLLLDNCEHLIEACAKIAENLLRACPHLRILATSREPLRIAGETLFSLNPLTVPTATTENLALLREYDAVRLFVARARAVKPDFALTEANAAPIAHLVRRLDGLPLALELAAARVGTLGVEQIAARVDDRFRLFKTGSRTATPRHQTLRGLIDWSYNLLAAPESILLRRLSVFAGRFTISAAEGVASDETLPFAEVVEHLSSLVEKSLVAMNPQYPSVRYYLLDTIREYGREKLSEAGEEAKVYARLVAFYLNMVETNLTKIAGPDQTAWMETLTAHHDNLLAAIRACERLPDGADQAMRLLRGLGTFWDLRGHYQTGIEIAQQVLAKPETQEKTLVRAFALYQLGKLLDSQGQFRQAEEPLQEALDIFTRLNDTRGMASVINILAGHAWRYQDFDTAKENYARVLAIWRELGDELSAAYALNNLGITARSQGDLVSAEKYYEQTLEIYRRLEHYGALPILFNNMGRLAWTAGKPEKAKQFYEEGLAIARKLGDKSRTELLCHNLGVVARVQGETRLACSLHLTSLDLVRELGDQARLGYKLSELIILAADLDDPQMAAQFAGAAQQQWTVLGASLLQDIDQQEVDAMLVKVRALLGEDIYTEAVAKGKALTLLQIREWLEAIEKGKPLEFRNHNTNS